MRDLHPFETRVHHWDHAALKHRECPLCGDPGEPKYRRPDQLVVNYCLKCSSFFVSTAPSEEELDRLYARYFQSYRHSNWMNDKQFIKAIANAKPHEDYRICVLSALFLDDLKGKAALDVGFGMGHTLIRLKRLGAAVTGIELDDDALHVAREYLAVNDVRKCTIEQIREPASYSVVTLFDVVEHTLQPVRMLQRASNLLDTGGVLAVSTPNGAVCLGQEEPITFRVDLEHMQYLTPATVNYLADKLSMEIVHLEASGFPVLPVTSPRELLTARFSALKIFLNNGLGSYPFFQFLKRIYRAARSPVRDPRRGNYHLFFVLRKT